MQMKWIQSGEAKYGQVKKERKSWMCWCTIQPEWFLLLGCISVFKLNSESYSLIAGVNGDDPYDFLAANPLLDQQAEQSQVQQDMNPGETGVKPLDLTSLLSSKLQQENSSDAARGLHFLNNDDYNAKRNLTLMLDPAKQNNQVAPGATGDSNGGVNIFEDAFNSGSYADTNRQELPVFSTYTPKGDVTLTSASLYGEDNKFGCGVPQSGNTEQCTSGLPTPPGSQNQTPDLTQELNFATSMQQQQPQQQHQQHSLFQSRNAAATNGRSSNTNSSVIAALLNNTGPSLVDTPSSLDTLSGQDSRESLGDPFLHGFTDTVTDMTSDLSGPQPMEMGEPLDFTLCNVDNVMPQMVP